MSAPANNAGCFKTAFYLGLGALGLWLGWQLLLVLGAGLATLSLALFNGLDASYGQLGGLYGYVLLGLGLGAAAGAIAAQQRFRLSKLVVVAAGAALALLLGSAVWVGASDGRLGDYFRAQNAPASASSAPAEAAAPTPAPAAPAATTEALPPQPAPMPADSVAAVAADTTSQPARGLRRVIVSAAPLRISWADSLAQPAAQLQEADTVRLLRQTPHWARVVRTGPDSAAAPAGWLRRTALGPLRGPEPTAPKGQSPRPAPTMQAGPPEPVAAAPGAPAHPTGHQQYAGQIGQESATYSLDWQANGVLSGSYFYNQQPAVVHRLTGEVAADGTLRLLEFTRGRQSARCVLQPRAGGYAGTLTTTSGQQLAMSLE